MVDALASGASVRKGVGVQIPPRAQIWMGPDKLFVGAHPFWLVDLGGAGVKRK